MRCHFDTEHTHDNPIIFEHKDLEALLARLQPDTVFIPRYVKTDLTEIVNAFVEEVTEYRPTGTDQANNLHLCYNVLYNLQQKFPEHQKEVRQLQRQYLDRHLVANSQSSSATKKKPQGA